MKDNKTLITKISIIIGAILLLLNTIGLYRVFTKDDIKQTISHTRDTIIIKSEIEGESKLDKKDYTVINNTYLPENKPFDTLAFLKDYNTKKTITSLEEDSNLTYFRVDTLFKNNIIGSHSKYTIHQKKLHIIDSIKVTNTIDKTPKLQPYFGGSLSLPTDGTIVFGVAPVVGLSFKKFNIDIRYQIPSKKAELTLIKKF